MTGRPAPRHTGTGRSPRGRARFVYLISSLLATFTVTVALVPAGCGAGEPANSSPSSTTSSPVKSTAVQRPAGFPITLTDDLGRSATIPGEPQRIVSTAPSNTEILFALGLGSRVVGVSSLDDYPPEAQALAKIGDFQVNPEAVLACDPDLVLGFLGNEDALAVVSDAGIPVLVFDPASVEGIYADIETIGRATGALSHADALIASVNAAVEAVAETARTTGASPRVFYALDTALWTAGPGSFLDELIGLAHAINVAGEVTGAAVQPYYQLAPEQLAAVDPDVILLPNTAFASIDQFTSDPRFSGLKAVKEGRVILIDDVIVTRPGPRIAEGLEVLAAAIHPEAAF